MRLTKLFAPESLFALLLVAAVCCCVLVYVGWDFLTDPFDRRSFDQQAWVAASTPRERASMVRDAMRLLAPGTPEQEVTRLLGKPSGTAPVRPGVARTYHYYLGGWSGVAYDSTFLWVHLDENGKVIRAELGGY